jgi:capsular exopolysaccharide synthesis family protein
MSVLKALQKKRTEETSPVKPVRVTPPAPENTVRFDRVARSTNQPPEMLASNDLAIGKPGSAFIGQPDPTAGTALPGYGSELTAGAKLNAESLTRSASKNLPDFVSWTVDAERVEPRLVAITHPNSTYCEEYRSLRTHVLHKSQRQKLQSIVVASVNPSEGKSITALNLAWMLAQTDGTNALIIDADLRLPSLAEYMGIETDKGLSDVLAGTDSITDCIVKLEPGGLHILPGGEARNDVAELISGPKFRDILSEAREMFDFVIIDAPPLGIFTDATVLINHADGALLVLRANRTRTSVLERVLEPLPKDRFLGVVLNQSEDVMEETHYHYGYYNYNYRRLNEGITP